MLKHCSCYWIILAKHGAEVCTGMKWLQTLLYHAHECTTSVPHATSARVIDRITMHAYTNQWEQTMSKSGNANPAQRRIKINKTTYGCAQHM